MQQYHSTVTRRLRRLVNISEWEWVCDAHPFPQTVFCRATGAALKLFTVTALAACLLFTALLLTGCGDEAAAEQPVASVVIPTNAPLITDGLTMEAIQPVAMPDSEATVSHLFSDLSGTEVAVNATLTAIPQPTRTPIPTAIPTQPVQTSSVIYYDGLSADWNIRSFGTYTTGYTAATASGDRSIMFDAELGGRVLLFTVNQSAERSYRHDDVLGITFMMTSPDGDIGLQDVAVTVIGSNRYFYWVEGDQSVQNVASPNLEGRLRDDPISNAYADHFPESAIEFLHVARAIPKDGWVPVTVYLPERIFAPEYRYVTGFYIKVDELFDRRILIDDIRVLEWGE